MSRAGSTPLLISSAPCFERIPQPTDQRASPAFCRRLPLNQAVKFGDTNYSKEEIVAEMGASFLVGHTGIEQVTLTNNAAYLAGWIKALKGDAKLVIVAAAAAQKATDYVLNRQAETAQETAIALAA
jgi:antirestriction protein ArdC